MQSNPWFCLNMFFHFLPTQNRTKCCVVLYADSLSYLTLSLSLESLQFPLLNRFIKSAYMWGDARTRQKWEWSYTCACAATTQGIGRLKISWWSFMSWAKYKWKSLKELKVKRDQSSPIQANKSVKKQASPANIGQHQGKRSSFQNVKRVGDADCRRVRITQT